MEIDIKDIITTQLAEKLLENIPEEIRNKLIQESLTKTLSEAIRPWNIESCIKKDVEKYMIEYLSRIEVQEKIKEKTEIETAKLMQGVINVIVSRSQEAIKSDYAQFIEKKSIADVK